MTQTLRQPLSEVRHWERIPYDTMLQILELKRQSVPKMGNKEGDYEADPYSEAAWLQQFGDKL